MTARAEVVAEARTWLGTRFHHQGTLKGVGCDCVGLVLGVGHSLGIFPADLHARPEFASFLGYNRRPNSGQLEQGCQRFATQIQVSQALPGDVMLFRWDSAPQHAAILGDYPEGGFSIIHAYAPSRKVIETRFDDTWRARAVRAYRLPGVA